MNRGEPYIIFELGHAAYALRSADVLHIEMLENVTPVPNAAAAVEGIVFSRGQLYPALNLRVRFGMERVAPSMQSRLLFVTLHQRTVALVVDSAREFRLIPADAIRPVEAELHGIHGNYVTGAATINDRMVLLLDLLAVLNLDDPSPLIAAQDEVAATPLT